MNKSDIIEAVSVAEDIPKAQAKRILNSMLDLIMDEVAQGGAVQINGFGTFGARHYEPRTYVSTYVVGRVHKGERTLPRFRAHAAFKDLVEKTAKDRG